jgi:hypothetical protein
MQTKLLGIISADFEVRNQLLIILQNKWEYDGAMPQSFIDCHTASDSVSREVLYNLVEVGVPMSTGYLKCA